MKVKCDERGCNWRGDSQSVLKAQNPFLPAEIIMGCPECMQVETIIAVCDQEGCWETSTCGKQTPDGYRHTCSTHMPKL